MLKWWLVLLVLVLTLLWSAGADVGTTSKPSVHTFVPFEIEPVNELSTKINHGPAYSDSATHEPAHPGHDEHGAAGAHGDHEQHVEHFHIASVDFGRVQIPFIISLWIFCASLAKIGFHMTHSLSKIFPESTLLIVVGVFVGILLFYTHSADVSPLTPVTFFIYMLPPIILDAGYFMPNRLFFDHLGTILLMAVVGTIWNTVTIGVSLYLLGLTGIYGLELGILPSFLFSSLISAVDPVAVLAMFEEVQVNEVLYIIVFGESLLNDAVTVVLYHMFESYTAIGEENIAYTDILSGFASFFVVAFGGTLVGIIWGYLTAFVTRFTHHVNIVEPVFVVIMSYLAYLNAEIFHLSGILAITFCGMTMKNYVQSNVSEKSLITIKYTIKMLSQSSETIIFLFLGVATVHDRHDWNTWFVIFTIIFCSVYRAIGVGIFIGIANRFRLHKIDRVEKFVMAYGGLRGAIAFALALTINAEILPEKNMFVTATIAMVYFTVFFQGITLKPLVHILGVKRSQNREMTMNERIHERYIDHLMAGIEEIIGHTGDYSLRDRYKKYDRTFIRRCLLRDHHIAEPKIIETFSKLQMEDALKYVESNKNLQSTSTALESLSAVMRGYRENSLSVPDPGILWHQDKGSSFIDSMNHSMPPDDRCWNLDLGELEYNPTKKDMTDAKIKHLLDVSMAKPFNTRSTILYNRHSVNYKDLPNERMEHHIGRVVLTPRRFNKKIYSRNVANGTGDGKQVTFAPKLKSGTDKQLKNDHVVKFVNEINKPTKKEVAVDDDEDGIIFKAVGDVMSRKNKNKKKGKAEGYDNEAFSSFETDLEATIGERMLPWRREMDDVALPITQKEFPLWVNSPQYTNYYSPSSTLLARLGADEKRTSIIGLFNRHGSTKSHHSGSRSRANSLKTHVLRSRGNSLTGLSVPSTPISSLSKNRGCLTADTLPDKMDNPFVFPESSMDKMAVDRQPIIEEEVSKTKSSDPDGEDTQTDPDSTSRFTVVHIANDKDDSKKPS